MRPGWGRFDAKNGNGSYIWIICGLQIFVREGGTFLEFCPKIMDMQSPGTNIRKRFLIADLLNAQTEQI